MALTIAGLQNYVEENAFELLSKAVLGSTLSNYVQIRAGLQGNAVEIPLLGDDFATGSSYILSGTGANMGQNYDTCGWSANGATTISQVPMNLYHAKVQRAYCVQTLRDTFMSRQLSAGAAAGAESLPFEEMAASHFAQGITKFNEYYLINGAASVTDQFSETVVFKGLKGLAAGSSAMTKYNDAGGDAFEADVVKQWTSALTPATGEINALDGALKIFEAADPRIMLADDVILVVGYDDFKKLIGAMVNKNLYHYTADVSSVTIPGSNIKVVPSGGIAAATATGVEGHNFRFLTTGSNIIMGTDLTSDFDEFKVWYSQDNDEVRSSMKWTVGVAVVQDDLCVSVNDTPVAA